MDLNTRFFFAINRLSGRNKWLDSFGRAGAEWVVFAMAGWFMVSLSVSELPDYGAIVKNTGYLVGAGVVTWVINNLVGMIVKESRPQVLFPQIRLLFKPFSLWKSFPSDHAALAFLICFMGAALQVPWSWNLIPLALWVGWGRVYAGVHYPLDILGGMVTAGIVTMLFRAIVKV